MKKVRKGFTLVELLIVVAILGTLSAAMMVSFGSSSAAAKAATIAGNIDACITAAKLYLADNINTVATDSTASAFLGNTTGTIYVPNWSSMTSGTIVYAAGTGTGITTDKDVATKGWDMTVTVSAADTKEIIDALNKIKGYETSTTFPAATAGSNYKITVKLLDGTVKGEVVSGS